MSTGPLFYHVRLGRLMFYTDFNPQKDSPWIFSPGNRGQEFAGCDPPLALLSLPWLIGTTCCSRSRGCQHAGGGGSGGMGMGASFWVNYNELTTSSLEIIVSKGNHPQMALIQVCELLILL